MKKLSLLLCISSLLCFSIHASAKKTGLSEAEICKVRDFIAEQRNANAERLVKMSASELATIIANTEFEKAGMLDNKMSKAQFQDLLHGDHRLAFITAHAFTDLTLLASQKKRLGYFNEKAAIQQSVGLSIELADAAFGPK